MEFCKGPALTAAGRTLTGQLAGIYWFDGRPISRADRRETRAGLTGANTTEHPGVLIAWNGGTSTTRAQFETDVALGSHSICIVDGRVDNPGETAMQLYENGGVEALGKLIGDWSLVIWDSLMKRVVLASDYAGTRPLYYFRSDFCLAWSSSLDHLARWMNCDKLQPGYLSAFLRTGFPKQLTPYDGIYPVPAGGAITASPEQFATTTTWNPPPAYSVRYRHEAEYEEQFLTLFRDAVAARLKGGEGVAAELSGGLDSSSIVCVADQLITSGGTVANGLTTFSYLSQGSPDLRYIGVVEQACRTLTAVHLDGPSYPLLTPSSPGGALPVWAESRLIEVRSRMREMGLGVLLTGQLGDLITGNLADDSEQAADAFRSGQVVAGLRESLAWSRSLNTPLYPVVWRALRSALTFRNKGTSPSQRKRLGALEELLASRFFQSPEPLADILYSHPFTHRPLVEFLLSVPPAVVCRPGEPRGLMRRALRGIVPDAILRRRSKGNYEGLFLQSLRACATNLLESSQDLWLARLGCVDGRQVATSLRKLSQGLGPAQGEPIQQVIRLELWLRERLRLAAISIDKRGMPEMGMV